jgi:ribulose-phosphate 3-epimerase
MLKCATSLWSADLAHLAADIKRVEPYSDRFHIDVADGRYVDLLLFFPDLVSAIRPHTALPFEVHLIAYNPLRWVDAFIEAGADSFIFYFDATDNPAAVIEAIKSRGKPVGMSLRLEDSVDVLEPYWDELSLVTLVGTHMGVKGAAMDESLPGKIRQARQIIDERGLQTEIQADGGIRRHTVPLIHAAGADVIVPGSLMFKEDPAAIQAWLQMLD